MEENLKLYNAIFKGKDNKAFRILYKNILPKVKAYIITNNGSEQDAEDIFQEAIIILVRKIREKKFRKGEKIEPYIFTISKYLWIDKVRANTVHAKYQNYAERNKEISDAVHEQIELKERRNDIDTILAQLGTKCYDLFKQLLTGNTDYKEIAELIKVGSKDVVKTYKNRCKKKLIELLNNNASYKNQLLKYERGFKKYI